LSGIRHFVTAAAGLIACSLFAFGGGTVQAKVDFDTFSAEQQQWFWDQLNDYAQFDAFLRFCGHDPNFEQRMQAAARECVTDQAIQKVRSVYRTRVVREMKKNRPGICTAPDGAALIPRMEKTVNQAVRDVESACRTCAFCR
jgi:hypothetical protein